jgi:hypothetical protein
MHFDEFSLYERGKSDQQAEHRPYASARLSSTTRAARCTPDRSAYRKQ